MNKVKVFISWSGERSKAVAELLKKWIPRVIQSVDTYFSADDIDKGIDWFGNIADNLSSCRIGIICLTMENKDKPWILFEVGALSKGLPKNHVCPLLIDVTSASIGGPLSKFQSTKINDKDDMLKLFKTINNSLTEDEGKIGDELLYETFDDIWSKYSDQYNNIIKDTISSQKTKDKTTKEMFANILEAVSAIDRKTDDFKAFNIVGGNPTFYDTSGINNMSINGKVIINYENDEGKRFISQEEVEEKKDDTDIPMLC